MAEAAQALLENDVQAPMKVHAYILDGGTVHAYAMKVHSYTHDEGTYMHAKYIMKVHACIHDGSTGEHTCAELSTVAHA